MIDVLDLTDPLVIFLAWSFTLLAKRVIRDSQKLAKVRHVLPLIALVLAIVFRSLFDTLLGQELTWTTVLRALGAAGLAVMAHSQIRELQKAAMKKEDAAPIAT